MSIEFELDNFHVVGYVCGVCGNKLFFDMSVRPEHNGRIDSVRADVLRHLMVDHKRRQVDMFSVLSPINAGHELVVAEDGGALPGYFHEACEQPVDTLLQVLEHECRQRPNCSDLTLVLLKETRTRLGGVTA